MFVTGSTAGPWKKWFRRTRKKSKVFGGPNNRPIAFDNGMHTYEFSARSVKVKRNKKPKRSQYSPPEIVTT